ncbi:hypothetical protein GCM10007301_38990 [Azorhizobium oxalatiphilum]|uniref:Fatty acid desaturase n=1 Tax=Azorhizobium oxalatiphilum TaxID=980631 RepID=A0A917C710_9HYPH|nr:hypothetical protein [Azorhizobium oxalatiphilum]GGF75307.1 hypothetical protein GCM10007301_38990 [Azorhizobium oxalatiphilum]
MSKEVFSHRYTGDDRLNRIFADRFRLPVWLQRLHAAQTGLPDPRTTARRTTPLRVLARDLTLLAGFSALAGGMASLAGITTFGGLAAAGVSGLATLGVVGRLRRLVVGHTHEASHWMISKFYRQHGVEKDRARQLNEAILDLGSALTLTRNGQDYRAKHRKHHEEPIVGTLMDPDGMDLHAWGLWAGRKITSLPRALLVTALDPVWHLGMIASRLRSNFAAGSWQRRALALPALAFVTGSAFILPLQVWLMAIGLPWTVGYNIAALLQVVTEHPYAQKEGGKDHASHAARNWMRVPVELMPDPALKGLARLKAWTRWLVRMALIHVPTRLAVLDGPMIAHGWHHMAWPTGHAFSDWWETARRELEARHAGDLPPEAATRVLFGLPEAIGLQEIEFRKDPDRR